MKIPSEILKIMSLSLLREDYFVLKKTIIPFPKLAKKPSLVFSDFATIHVLPKLP